MFNTKGLDDGCRERGGHGQGPERDFLLLRLGPRKLLGSGCGLKGLSRIKKPETRQVAGGPEGPGLIWT